MTYSIAKSNDHANAALFYNWLLLFKKQFQDYVSQKSDDTFLYHERVYQIIWNIKSCRSLYIKNVGENNHICIVLRVHLSNYKLVKLGVKSWQVWITIKNSVRFDQYSSILRWLVVISSNVNIGHRIPCCSFRCFRC